MRSMCARHSGLRGDRGGECVARSTAVEKTSIWRPATAGMPNLACTISPCASQAPRQDMKRLGHAVRSHPAQMRKTLQHAVSTLLARFGRTRDHC